MKMRIASGIVCATWRAPWTSISSTTDAPSRGALLELGAQRAVAAAGVLGVLEEVALDDAAVELGVVEEVVVRAVLLPRARRARGRGDGELELGHALEQRADERALADPGGAGDDEDLSGHCGLAAQHRDELGALARREAADRLRRRDAAELQDLVDLHAPVLRYREQQVEDLRRMHVLGRLEQQVVDADLAGLEVALERRAPASGSRSRAGAPPCAGRGNALGQPWWAWRASSSLAAWAASLQR